MTLWNDCPIAQEAEAKLWPRRGTQAYEILSLMSSGQWVHFSRLNAICYRYGGRLHDIKRRLGIEHETMKDDGGAVWYRLILR